MGLESIIDKTKNFLVKGALMASIGIAGIVGVTACATTNQNTGKAPEITINQIGQYVNSDKPTLLTISVTDKDHDPVKVEMQSEAEGIELEKYSNKDNRSIHYIVGDVSNCSRGSNPYSVLITATDSHKNSTVKETHIICTKNKNVPKLLINPKISYGYNLFGDDDSPRNSFKLDFRGTASSRHKRIIPFYGGNVEIKDSKNILLNPSLGVMAREIYRTTPISLSGGFIYHLRNNENKFGGNLKFFGDEIGQGTINDVIDDFEWSFNAILLSDYEWSTEVKAETIFDDLVGFGLLASLKAEHFDDHQDNYLKLIAGAGIKYRIDVGNLFRIDLKTKGTIDLIEKSDPGLLLEMTLEY
jgi:hypothetical protein